MLKYTDTMVTFREVPDEISLCINLSNCPNHCPDCHSKELWEDIGKRLTLEEAVNLIEENDGITCICFMGGDADVIELNLLCIAIKSIYKDIKLCWYTGQNRTEEDIKSMIDYLDFIKTGPYIKEYGALDNPSTNQHFYMIKEKKFIDITKKFQKLLTI